MNDLTYYLNDPSYKNIFQSENIEVRYNFFKEFIMQQLASIHTFLDDKVYVDDTKRVMPALNLKEDLAQTIEDITMHFNQLYNEPSSVVAESKCESTLPLPSPLSSDSDSVVDQILGALEDDSTYSVDSNKSVANLAESGFFASSLSLSPRENSSEKRKSPDVEENDCFAHSEGSKLPRKR